MTDHPIKLTLLNTLLLCCLQGFLAGAVLANAISQGQERAPAGKRKPLHEYGPEDVHPEAQENENSEPRKRLTPQPKARNMGSLAPKSNVAPPALTSTPKSNVARPALTSTPKSNVARPALTSTPMPVVTPARVESPAAGSAVMPAVTPAPARAESPAPSTASTPSAPHKAPKSDEFRRKLLVSLSIFLLLFLALVFFAIKMWRQIRAGSRAAMEKVSQEQLPATERRQLRIVGQGAPEKRVNRAEIKSKNLKTKAQNGRGARFKKA